MKKEAAWFLGASLAAELFVMTEGRGNPPPFFCEVMR